MELIVYVVGETPTGKKVALARTSNTAAISAAASAAIEDAEKMLAADRDEECLGRLRADDLAYLRRVFSTVMPDCQIPVAVM